MIWKLPKVSEMTGLKKGAIYKLMRANDFPKNLKLTDKAVGWDSDEIEDWIENRKKERV